MEPLRIIAKQRIGIDIDDTATAMLEDWVNHIAHKTGLPCTHWRPYLDGGFFTFWKEVLDQTGYNPMAWWHTPDLYDGRKLIDGVYDAVQSWIDKGHEVFFISSSVDDHITSKDKLIQSAFPDIEIIHTSKKAEVQMDVFIDDAEHNVLAVLDAQPSCFIQMPRTPVNKSFANDFTSGALYAVDNWIQIRNNVDAYLFYSEQA